MKNLLVILATCSLAAGCATTSAVTNTGGPAPEAGTTRGGGGGGLSFQLVVTGGEGTAARGVPNRVELPSGTRFAVRLVAEQPAYVYAWHRGDGPTAKAERILPAEGGAATQALPQAPIVLPAEGQWFSLDDKPGKEYFYAIASTAALDEGKLQAIAADIPIDREPPMTSASDRDGGPLYRAGADETGLARLVFTIVHR